MLFQLKVQNIALIEELVIEFGEGLNVLTGETGAGKSIVIDAMNLALGERADRDLIRSGEQKAQVHALFDISASKKAKALLDENGIPAEDGELVVSRELLLSGRNVVRVNGSLAPLALLKQLSALLVDVHGQHEHQSLMDESRHLAFLDAFAGEALDSARAEVAALYAAWRELSQRLAQIRGGAQQRAQRLDMLQYQATEIESARLRPGEEEELAEKRSLFRNGERIAAALGGALQALEGGESAPGALDAARQALTLLGGIAKLSKEFSTLEEALADAVYGLEDVASQLFDQNQGLEFDPKELERAENRLDLIKNLKRKYGADVSAVLAYLDQISGELQQLKSGNDDSAALEAELKRAEEALLQAELRLSALRRESGKRFEAGLLSELQDLGMAGARFMLEFNEIPSESSALRALHSADGLDRLRFLLSANRGEDLKPLSHTASGGELSRIMLAFKALCAGEVRTMVFDEIDTGISGHMAQVVGEKMCAIGGERQVICVTHLPQIAALGHSHLLVQKREEGGRTITFVEGLTAEQRVVEIARMIGGKEITSSALEHAREMLSPS
ncbi:MAG: DNA repair protein RecN [Christensenellaceae bacterium]|jgi:DNA repair protein RecN (Recombination protein N)|nr:DNA repair protein RecN [Christensenellaceae bacterium]